MPLLLRAPSNKNPLKFQWLNKHPGRYVEYLRYSQKFLVWKSFEQSFNRYFIRPNSNVWRAWWTPILRFLGAEYRYSRPHFIRKRIQNQNLTWQLKSSSFTLMPSFTISYKTFRYLPEKHSILMGNNHFLSQ